MRHATNSLLEEKESNQLVLWISVIVFFIILICLYIMQRNILSGRPTSIMIVYSLIYALVGISGFRLIKNLYLKEIKIEKLFLTLIIPLGIIYTLLIPPGVIPDEWTHMYSANSLASQLMGKEQDDLVTMRASDIELYNTQTTNPNNDYYNFIYSNIFKLNGGRDYQTINVDSVSMRSLFGYFPAVIGIIMCRIIGFGVVTTFYLGRLCNFVFYIILTYQAVKKIPFGKLLLFAITMLPMASHQMFSLSYDTVLNAASFLCIGYGMFFVYQANEAQLKDILLYSFCGLLLLANKGSAYAFILVIPILAKYFNPNGDKIAKKTKIIIFLIVTICILLLNYRSFTDSTTISAIQSVSGAGVVPWSGTPSYTLALMLENIPGTISLFLNTFVQKGWWYINTAIGSELGWLNILMPNWIINSWLGILLFSAIAEQSHREVFTSEHKLLYFLISFGVIFIVMLAMALAWTPMGYEVIEGVQGRYYIPIIFLLLICLQNSKFYLKKNIVKILLVVIPIMSVISIYNIIPLVL